MSEFSDWTLAQAAPTAASVSVGGQVITPNGYGISNAFISITDENGNNQNIRTKSFGYFQFEDVEAGKTYTMSIRHR